MDFVNYIAMQKLDGIKEKLDQKIPLQLFKLFGL